MSKLNIVFYSKPECSQCDAMLATLDKWAEHTDSEYSFTKRQIADDMDIIARSGALSAPIIEITHEGREPSYVYGLNPDYLVDVLNDDKGVWDF